MTADEVLDKIRQLSSEYLVSRMPVRLVALEAALQIPAADLLPYLEELRLRGMLFHDSNYVLLSYKGTEQ